IVSSPYPTRLRTSRHLTNWVASRADGHGCVASFQIRSSAGRFFMATPRVLVVEDDDSVRMMLHEGLHRDVFEVVLASNVRDALRLIATETFDVLLSDLHMPLAGDGFTLVSAMRHTH